MIAVLIAILLGSPLEQVEGVARLMGRPDLARDLRAIAKRECSGKACGIHRGDVPASGRMFAKARRVGWIKEWCPFHQDRRELGVRGILGMSAAYSLRYLPFSCVPPSWLDWPPFSAAVGVLRMEGMCERHGACTRAQRAAYWRGIGNVLRSRS